MANQEEETLLTPREGKVAAPQKRKQTPGSTSTPKKTKVFSSDAHCFFLTSTFVLVLNCAWSLQAVEESGTSVPEVSVPEPTSMLLH